MTQMPAKASKRPAAPLSGARTTVHTTSGQKKRPSASKSPTQRSLKHLRDAGYTVAVVERWNPHARIRQDLFGIFDLLAIRRDEIAGVQVTASGVSERISKITDAELTPRVRESGMRILIHGWRKNAAGKWVLREVDIS